ncbi:MAG TPA: ImmA/IrrE family metallo-endopeptidase, partial [Mycobacterium sp.]|nr:ImmA/IrrE family metallo-endopeptidase [Mycobacterium sp.]
MMWAVHPVILLITKIGVKQAMSNPIRYTTQTPTCCGVARWLMPCQRAFQIATQLGLLSQSDLLSAIVATDDQLSAESRGVARIGLANYFAGAFLLPYREFHHAAEELRY